MSFGLHAKPSARRVGDPSRQPTLFREGECVDLHAYSDADLEEWAAWFNDPSITRFLPQGNYPNTVHDQRRFIQDAQAVGRFLALVKSKKGQLLGVVSLSEVTHHRRSAQIAYVVPVKDPEVPYAALEAISLVVEHAFWSLDLDRVWGGQHHPGLVRWSQALELLGFVTEGIHRDVGRKERRSYDSLTFAVPYRDFERIVTRRGGRLWPGSIIIAEMLRSLAEREPHAARVDAALSELRHEQSEWLAALDHEHLRQQSG